MLFSIQLIITSNIVIYFFRRVNYHKMCTMCVFIRIKFFVRTKIIYRKNYVWRFQTEKIFIL